MVRRAKSSRGLQAGCGTVHVNKQQSGQFKLHRTTTIRYALNNHISRIAL